MFNLYFLEKKPGGSVECLVSSHKTIELAYKRLCKEVKKHVKTTEHIKLIDVPHIYEFGLWGKYYVIKETLLDEN